MLVLVLVLVPLMRMCLAVCESNFRSCPQLKSNIIWSRRKHRIELNFYDVFAKWLHKSQIFQTGSDSKSDTNADTD